MKTHIHNNYIIKNHNTIYSVIFRILVVIYIQTNNIMRAIKIGKITNEQILTSQRATSREIAIENNLNICHHRVHKSKKSYTRKDKHKGREF
jgi:hypothetical protein